MCCACWVVGRQFFSGVMEIESALATLGSLDVGTSAPTWREVCSFVRDMLFSTNAVGGDRECVSRADHKADQSLTVDRSARKVTDVAKPGKTRD